MMSHTWFMNFMRWEVLIGGKEDKTKKDRTVKTLNLLRSVEIHSVKRENLMICLK